MVLIVEQVEPCQACGGQSGDCSFCGGSGKRIRRLAPRHPRDRFEEQEQLYRKAQGARLAEDHLKEAFNAPSD
jgi:radical SAM superfamily enzyme with C-terminal helix-hairpin-helix motif